MDNTELSRPSTCDLSQQQRVILESEGDKYTPSVTFSVQQESGWYLNNDGEVVFSAQGSDNIIQSSQYTEFKKPIVINLLDTDVAVSGNKGILYTKSNSTYLWWKHADSSEVKLCDNNGGGGEIGEIKYSDLIDDRTEEQKRAVPIYPLSADNGTVSSPSIAFDNSSSSGLYSSGAGVINFASSGVDKFIISANDTKILNRLHAYDGLRIDNLSNDVGSVDDTYGYLYKSADDSRLYWKTESKTYDLTQLFNGGSLSSQLQLTDGSSSAPGVAFINSTDTGMYYDNGLVFADGGTNGIKLSSGKLLLYNALGFNGDDDTGLEKISGDVTALSFKIDDVSKFIINENELISSVGYKNINGTSSEPAYGFSGADNAGMYMSSGNVLIEAPNEKKIISQINNVDVMEVSSDGVSMLSGNIKLTATNTVSNESSGVVSVGVNEDTTDLILSTREGTNPSRKYACSEIFTVGDNNLSKGDVVGILNDGTGRIDKIQGGLWSSEVKHYTGVNKTSVMHHWENDLHIQTYETVAGVGVYTSTLTLQVDTIDSSDLSSFNSTTVVLDSNVVLLEYPSVRSVACVRINDDPYRFVVAYSDGDDIKLKKIKVTIASNVPTVLVEATASYTPTEDVESFDIVYDNTGDIDTIVLVMFSGVLNNFEVVLYKANYLVSTVMTKGYAKASLTNDVVIADDKTCNALLLPGQIVVCSYGNAKTFILLSSAYDEAFTCCDMIIDTDSSDCVDMIYDTQNAVIISIEQTISDTAFLQIYDIFGTQISQVRTRKLSESTFIPLGLSVNPDTDMFSVYYTDSSSDGQIKSQVFYHDGESINLGLVFTRSTNSELYSPVVNGDDNVISHNGKRVHYLGNNRQVISWSSENTKSTSALFNDYYGIQPTAFIGITNHAANSGDLCGVTPKGQIYHNTAELSNGYVGKKIYLNSNNMNATYPSNLSTTSIGNVFIGTVLTQHKILLGL